MTAERHDAPKVAPYGLPSENVPAPERPPEPGVPSDAVKILLVDKHPFIRSGLKMLIESRPGMRVVGAAGDCRVAGETSEGESPDVVLISVEPGEECRLECVAGLLETCASARALVVSDERGAEFTAACVRAGASGLVTKEAEPAALFKAIEKVHAGELWFERSAISAALSAMTRAPSRRDPDEVKIASLTARELEVIELVGQGLKNRQIAERLYICEATVSHHLTSIFSKLDLTDRLALVIFAYQHGLARLPGNGH
jgi:DNA-binding NarL/FixJ family response regulator